MPNDKLTTVDNNKVWLFDEKQLDDYTIFPDNTLTYDDSILDKSGDGALREGGAIHLLSAEAIALFTQYAGIGLILGSLPALSYPVYNVYLQMQGYQVASYSALMSLPWSLKIFMGIVSDCFPINGYQRRSYMMIGWFICAVSCGIMALSAFPSPYYKSEEVNNLPLANISEADQAKYINLNAPNSGGVFIMLSTLATIGSVMVAVSSDAMVVQYAQREPLCERGRIQTTCYVVRDSFRQLPSIIIGFCMNSYQYGGDFSWSITPTAIYAMLVVPSVVGFATALWYMVEERVERVSLHHYFRSFWQLVKLRVMWQLCSYNFFSNVFSFFDETVSNPMTSDWVQAQALNLQLFSVIGGLMGPVTMWALGKWALHWDWRSSIVISTFIWVGMRALVQLTCVWDVSRNQYAFLTGTMLMDQPMNVPFLFSAYASVEVADVGNEGLIYALTSSVSNLGYLFGPVMYKTVDSFFHVTRDDIRRDDTIVRWQATYCFLISYIVKIGALVFLVLLPRQKGHVQLLKRRGESSGFAGGLFIVLFFLVLIYALVTNALSFFESTYCLRIAGGNGCSV
ncbi:transmembrane protein [Thraustotheca clavata]|uniref:Transmembrane protein n=1 Tax=Thraustotheca clavata TaxID=74557 RepID=A0A1W0A6A3_9STRA|nr:transmembrane protein [Thraustotheca clavata]